MASRELALQCTMPMKLILLFALIFLCTVTICVAETSASNRFIRLDEQGLAIEDSGKSSTGTWHCVLDQKTGLVWEVKTRNQGLHYQDNTYSWFNPDTRVNGGLAGYPGGADCRSKPCDTRNFIEKVNEIGWCNAHDWRLPTREELRSLVNYKQKELGPAIDHIVFPNSVNQFYWSAESNATNAEEAWGIGFAFGFDYAYFKNNLGHVRLVRQSKKVLAKNGYFE